MTNQYKELKQKVEEIVYGLNTPNSITNEITGEQAIEQLLTLIEEECNRYCKENIKYLIKTTEDRGWWYANVKISKKLLAELEKEGK